MRVRKGRAWTGERARSGELREQDNVEQEGLFEKVSNGSINLLLGMDRVEQGVQSERGRVGAVQGADISWCLNFINGV